MKNIITFILLLFCVNLNAQPELISFNAIRLCDSVHVESSKVRPHLHSQSIFQDSIRIKVRLQENCGLVTKQGAMQLNDDTLTLLWTDNNVPLNIEDVIYESGTWFHPDSSANRLRMACRCYMELTYVFKNIQKLPIIKLKGKSVFEKDSMYQLFNSTFQIFEGDTINYTDSIGIKKGKWIEFDSLGRVTRIEIKISELFSEEFENFEYHENGKIATHSLSRRTQNGFHMEEKYYINGQLKERFFSSDIYFDHDHDYFEISYVEYFNEKGELIKRELIDVHNNLYEYGYFYE